jgi:hypothetical protein
MGGEVIRILSGCMPEEPPGHLIAGGIFSTGINERLLRIV